MTIGLSSTGLATETQEEVAARIRASVRGGTQQNINLEADSTLGQVIDANSSVAAQIMEALRALFSALNPAEAEGTILEYISAFTGTTRGAATKSTCTASVNLDPGSYAAGALIAHAEGDADALFVNTAALTNPGGVAATLADVVFEAVNPGPVRVVNGPSGLVVASPITGWNSISDVDAAVIGEAEDGDPELRIRRKRELSGQGTTTAPAIAAAVSRVEGVTDAIAFENDTDAVVDGMPPHTIEVLIDGPTASDADIAAAIFTAKAGGPRAHGSTVVAVTDSQGIEHQIGFTRKTVVNVYVRLVVEVLADYPGDATAEEQIVAAATAFHGLGVDVTASRASALAHEVTGVFNVFSSEVSLNGLDWVSRLTMTPRQVAAFSTARVYVDSSPTTE